MDKIQNTSSVILNYISDKDGIPISLQHMSKGGLTVALERRIDPLRDKDLSNQDVLNELSERAHQTILIGISPDQSKIGDNDFGYAKLILITADGQSREDKTTFLGYSYGDGCNECSVDDSIAPSNFAFILVPERLMPFIENIQHPCPVYSVDSVKYEVGFYGDDIKISCPDYLSKLKELYVVGGLLTHVVREKTKNEIS
jgi:hypothetical protein